MRLEMSLTQEQFGQMCYVTASTISEYELGKISPSQEVFELILNAYSEHSKMSNTEFSFLDKNFPQTLKTFRERLLLDQRDFAKLSKISPRMISDLESGNAKPSTKIIASLRELEKNTDTKNKVALSEIQKDFPEKLRKLLVHLGLSPSQFAQEIDVNKKSITEWLRGKKIPKISRVKKLEEFCIKNKIDFNNLDVTMISSKEIRQEFGWTQKDLADQASLEVPAIANWENAKKKKPTFASQHKLSTVYERTWDDLISKLYYLLDEKGFTEEELVSEIHDVIDKDTPGRNPTQSISRWLSKTEYPIKQEQNAINSLFDKFKNLDRYQRTFTPSSLKTPQPHHLGLTKSDA